MPTGPMDTAGTSGLKCSDQSKALLGRPVLLASDTWNPGSNLTENWEATIKATKHIPAHKRNFLPSSSSLISVFVPTLASLFYVLVRRQETALSLWTMTIRRSPMCNWSASPRICTVSQSFPFKQLWLQQCSWQDSFPVDSFTCSFISTWNLV